MWITFWFGKTAIKIRKEKTPFFKLECGKQEGISAG